uniref:Large ribosomal subunit protein mL46 N-terminal domain-containing protein n=1 Tax=Ditylum brightwellii TaxID=49249 RepID=A0A7S4RQR8_9STRA
MATVMMSASRKGIALATASRRISLPSSLLSESVCFKQEQQQQQSLTIREFGSSKNKKEEATLSYDERKAAAKEKRRQLHQTKVNRLNSLKTRRSNSPKDVQKTKFHSYFDTLQRRDEYLDRKARRCGKPWKVLVSAVVERLPVVTPDAPQWEEEYWEMKSMLMENSGKEFPMELANAGLSATSSMAGDTNAVYDRDDLLEQLKKQGFTPAPRETEADRTGQIQTLDRQLKTRVYLAIVPSSASSSTNTQQWSFPTVQVNDDETLLSAAKRSITSSIGTKLEFWTPSNCPLGVQLTPYEEEEDSEYFGTKTFFIKVQLDDEGTIEENENVVQDWGWLTREEMTEKVAVEQGEENSKFYHYLL